MFGGVPNQGLLDAHTILWRAILDDDGGDVAFISQDLSIFLIRFLFRISKWFLPIAELLNSLMHW